MRKFKFASIKQNLLNKFCLKEVINFLQQFIYQKGEKPSLKEMFCKFCDPKLPDKRADCKQYDIV